MEGLYAGKDNISVYRNRRPGGDEAGTLMFSEEVREISICKMKLRKQKQEIYAAHAWEAFNRGGGF